MIEAIKPPTQGVGVQGIASAKQGISQPIQVDWRHIAALPSFQMYAVEVSGHSSTDVDQWMDGFLNIRLSQIGSDALLNEYSQWHEAKGYWKNETPLGELIKG